MGQAIFRIAAAWCECADLVTYLKAAHAVPDSRDGARHLQAGQVAGIFRRWIEARPLQAVRPVDPGGLNLDQDLSGRRLRHRPHARFQDLRATGLGDFDDAHAVQQRHGGIPFLNSDSAGQYPSC